ncbi:MAG: hypothetical protein WC405_05985 [Syntrophales bacterium]
MKIYSHPLTYSTSAGTDIIDITEDVAAKVREAGISEGQALISVPGSTAASPPSNMKAVLSGTSWMPWNDWLRPVYHTATMPAGVTETVTPMFGPPSWDRR